MNYLLNKKAAKPQFSLKSIENSSLFKRRVSNANCHIDNHDLNHKMLINYTLNHVAADMSDDKNTITTTLKIPDSENGTEILNISVVNTNMESQMGKSVKFDVKYGLELNSII